MNKKNSGSSLPPSMIPTPDPRRRPGLLDGDHHRHQLLHLHHHHHHPHHHHHRHHYPPHHHNSNQIRDGDQGYSTEIGTFCGSDFPPIITSSSRSLWLRWTIITIIINVRPKPAYGRQGLVARIVGPGHSSSGYILGSSQHLWDSAGDWFLTDRQTF